MTVTEQDTQVEAEGTEAEGTEQAEKSNRGRANVKYLGSEGFDAEVLDELPDSEPAGRSRLYYDILEAVAQDNDNLGKWHPIARFGTATGAQSVKNQLNKQVEGKVMDKTQADMPAKDRDASVRGWLTPDQTREIPEYEGWKFEFEARKVAAESGKIGARDSILYARLVEAS